MKPVKKPLQCWPWISYDEWMAAVDAIIAAHVGVTSADLADFRSRDLYESGALPDEGAREALEQDDMSGLFLSHFSDDMPF